MKYLTVFILLLTSVIFADGLSDFEKAAKERKKEDKKEKSEPSDCLGNGCSLMGGCFDIMSSSSNDESGSCCLSSLPSSKNSNDSYHAIFTLESMYDFSEKQVSVEGSFENVFNENIGIKFSFEHFMQPSDTMSPCGSAVLAKAHVRV